MRHRYYKLNKHHQPIPCTIDQMAQQYDGVDNDKRRVAADVFGAVRISTVFLCIDHGWGDDGPPILFETMIFGGEYDNYQERYCTWDEAVAGHKQAVEMIKQSLNI